MHCTNCGTAIPGDARFCPGCGAASAVRTNTAAPIAARTPDPKASGNPLAKMNGCAFALLLIGVLWAAAQLTGSGHDPATEPAKAAIDPQAAAAKARVCDDGVAALFKAGVARARPAPDRLEVDEQAWAELPAAQKRIFAAGVRCSALRGYDGGALGEGTTIEGFHSGQTLAIATSAGVTLE